MTSDQSRSDRRSFLRQMILGSLGGWLAGRPAAAAPAPSATAPVPSEAAPAWARLITPYRECRRHNVEDFVITGLLQKAGVRVRPGTYTVEAGNVAALCAYPVLFTDNLAEVGDPLLLANVREYLYRGGFLYIDCCGNPKVTPSFRTFHERHLALFDRLFPEARLAQLNDSHPLFHAPFPVAEKELLALDNRPTASGQMTGATHGIFGVFDDDRLMVVLSQDCLRCAWNWADEEVALQQKLATNIHAYGLTMSKMVSGA